MFGKTRVCCDIRAFLCEFKQRLIDCYLQMDGDSDINSKDRYAFFFSFFFFFSSFKQNTWIVAIFVDGQKTSL